MELLNRISETLQKGDLENTKKLVAEALEESVNPHDILTKGLIAGMDVIGEKFKNGEIFIPHVLVASRAMHGGMDLLRPVLVEAGVESAGTFIIGTVEGDHHDIGKNLVIMMLEGKGFDVTDLGINVTADRFVEVVRNTGAPLLGMSALLSTTRPMMKETIEALKEAGIREKVKVIVGGGAVTQEYAREIGADGYGQDATESAERALELVGTA